MRGIQKYRAIVSVVWDVFVLLSGVTMVIQLALIAPVYRIHPVETPPTDFLSTGTTTEEQWVKY